MSETESYGCGRALRELIAIFEGQWANGLLPHIRFVAGQSGYRPDPDDWGVTPEIAGHTRVQTSGITQPPIMGFCAWEVFRRRPAASAHLGEWLAIAAGLDRFHRFLLTERDPRGDGLACCVHPWETGTDNSPAFEPLLVVTRSYIDEQKLAAGTFARGDRLYVPPDQRPTDQDYFAYSGLISLFRRHRYDQVAITAATPFLLQDVLFNCLLVASLTATARLEEALAELVAPKTAPEHPTPDAVQPLLRQAESSRTAAARVVSAIRTRLWSEEDGLFYCRDARRGALIPAPTVSSLLPLLENIASPAQASRLVAHLRNPEEYALPFPVPSTAATYADFDPRRYWTGPTWPVPNWLLVHALWDREPVLAAILQARTLRMIAESDADPAGLAGRAARVMELNGVQGGATTPSRRQYQHAWLWDSAIAAIGWTYVRDQPAALAPTEPGPMFWEYYHPLTGEPLGAPLMTWTAAVFLDLLGGGPRKHPVP